MARQIRAGGARGTVIVNGYTDDQGSAAIGLVLSRQRAAAVTAVLSARTSRGWDSPPSSTAGARPTPSPPTNTSTAAPTARGKRRTGASRSSSPQQPLMAPADTVVSPRPARTYHRGLRVLTGPSDRKPVTTNATRDTSYPYPTGRWALVPSLVQGLLAGPTEELALVALPTVLFRRAGLPWPAVGLIALGLRLLFHLYYGWGTVGVACLALLVWAWYARTGKLWGPILVHTVIDVIGVTLVLGGKHRLDLGIAELAAGAVAFAVLTLAWSRQLPDLSRLARALPGEQPSIVAGCLPGRRS